MILTDVHSHMLPGIDDGSSDAEESRLMLEQSARQGVGRIFLTPHYYPTESARDFIAKRNAAAELLKSISFEGRPEVKTGAEVYYHIGIQYEEELKSLCFEDSCCVMIEMPWTEWGMRALQDVDSLYGYRGMLPVIAHLERYASMTSGGSIKQLKRSFCVIQMNAEYLIDPKTRKKALKAIKHGEVDLIGSDAHNMKGRTPNLGEAFEIIATAGLREQAEMLSSNAERLWNGEKPFIFRK